VTPTAITPQMANSMAVSEGALVQDVAEVQVRSLLLGVRHIGHDLVVLASCLLGWL
jgi:hypothetical protein